MICTILNTLPWLILTFTFSEALTLEVSSSVTAECGKPVVLHCNISSALPGLSVKHMEWSQSQTKCFVDSNGFLNTNDAEGDFYCRYDKGHLSLHFYKWSPWLFKSSFMCKLRSNHGILHEYAQVETKEHWESVKAAWDSITPTCTFRKVCPGGEVEWFQDSRRITDQLLVSTNKYVEAGSWITIHSYLKIHNSNKPYNCTLKSSSSGRYLTSSLIHPAPHVRSRAAASVPAWTFIWILVGIVFEKDFFLRFD